MDITVLKLFPFLVTASITLVISDYSNKCKKGFTRLIFPAREIKFAREIFILGFCDLVFRLSSRVMVYIVR